LAPNKNRKKKRFFKVEKRKWLGLGGGGYDWVAELRRHVWGDGCVWWFL